MKLSLPNPLRLPLGLIAALLMSLSGASAAQSAGEFNAQSGLQNYGGARIIISSGYYRGHRYHGPRCGYRGDYHYHYRQPRRGYYYREHRPRRGYYYRGGGYRYRGCR